MDEVETVFYTIRKLISTSAVYIHRVSVHGLRLPSLRVSEKQRVTESPFMSWRSLLLQRNDTVTQVRSTINEGYTESSLDNIPER